MGIYNTLVIAEPDGSYRRYILSDHQVVKVAREASEIALDLALGALR